MRGRGRARRLAGKGCAASLAFWAFLCASPPLFQDFRPAAASGGEGDGSWNGSSVIGLSFMGRHKAYPLESFSSPLVINDEISLQEIAVFCDPSQKLFAAYFRVVLGESILFSGTAAGAVADDLTTMTHWDMTSGKAVRGNLLGMQLVPIPVTLTTWSEWFSSHPDTMVFSPDRQ